MLKLNEPSIAQLASHRSARVISCSHFLPHPGLPHCCAGELGKAMGCRQMLQQLDQVDPCMRQAWDVHAQWTDSTGRRKNALRSIDRSPCSHSNVLPTHGLCVHSPRVQIGSGLHVYGHSHVNADMTIDGRRYVQHAVAATDSDLCKLMCVWDGQQLCARLVSGQEQ